MKLSSLKICILTAIIICLGPIMNAQITVARQALSSFGLSNLTPSPSIDFMSTAGETFITTLGGGVLSLVLTQGIHQPDNIYLTDIDPVSGLPFEFRAYPNPTTDQLILDFTGTFNRPIRVELYDIRGRSIPALKAEFRQSGQEIWEVSNLAEGVYMLRLMDENGGLLVTEPILKR